MPLSKLPEPDRDVLARRDVIVKDLEALLGPKAVISEVEGRRTFESDALCAYRSLPLAAVLPQTTEEVAKVLK
jgi:glycolate oxidase